MARKIIMTTEKIMQEFVDGRISLKDKWLKIEKV